MTTLPIRRQRHGSLCGFPTLIFVTVTVLFWLVLVIPATAQHPQLNKLWAGLVSTVPVTDFAVMGDAGYAVSPRGLEVYDLSAPPELRLHTTLSLIPHNDPRARVVSDTLLLVWDADTGVSILSIADPLAPRFLNHRPFRAVEDADLQGDWLYVAWRDGANGGGVSQMHWQKGSDRPGSNRILESAGGFRKVEVDGRYVYGLGFGFDTDVISVARVVEDAPAERLGRAEFEFLFVEDIAVRDSLLFVIPAKLSLNETRRVIAYGVQPLPVLQLPAWRVYDLPENYWVESFALLDSLLFFHLGRSLMPGHVERTLMSAHIAGDTALVFLDTLDVGLVRNDVNALPVKNIGAPFRWSRSFTMWGNRLVWRTYTELFSGAITQHGKMLPDAHRSIGHLSYDVDGMRDDLVFTLTTDTLYGMDFSDPRNPVFLSRIPLRAEGLRVIDENYLITFDSVVTLFDVSNLSSPIVLDTLNLGEGRIVWRADVKDSLIVLCCLDRGTVVLVVSGNRLHRACEIEALSTDALWTESGLLLTTLNTTTEVWESFPVFDSRYDWCQPERLNVWGKKGQALNVMGDTIVVAAGEDVLLYTASSLPDRPTFLTDYSLVNSATEIEVSNSVLFIEDNGFAFYGLRFDGDHTGEKIGPWESSAGWSADARFHVLDSMILAPEGFFGLQVFSFSFASLSVFDSTGMYTEIPTLVTAPNIVSDQTTVHFWLPSRSNVYIALYNSLGQMVRVIDASYREAGEHRISFEAEHLPSGTYLLHLTTDTQQAVSIPLQIYR